MGQFGQSADLLAAERGAAGWEVGFLVPLQYGAGGFNVGNAPHFGLVGFVKLLGNVHALKLREEERRFGVWGLGKALKLKTVSGLQACGRNWFILPA